MNPRTYESHMEWEYQGSGPQDPSSPFTHAAAKKGTSTGFGGFSSPSKASSRPNPFANLPSTPSSKPLPQLPKASVFTPQLASKVTAPPFRNPAFTTPRRPADEVIFSEASGAEDSPGMSDAPNDTPEVDHMGDVTMGGMLSPSRIDKSSRYAKSVFAKKSGKGELRAHRDPVKAGLLRKRKRHNLDKDVGSVVRYQEPDSDESGMDSDSSRIFRGGRSRSKKRPDAAPVKRGFFGSIFHMLDEHPNAPDNLHRWIQLFLNLVFISTIVGIAYTIYSTIRSDILTANEAARTELADKIAECARNFQVNGCADNNRPALVAICDEWAICLSQRPEAIMRVKVTVKQIAEIINEFSDAMNFKAWGFFFAILVVCVFSNNMMLGRHESAKTPAMPQPSGPANIPDDPSVMWMPVATPRMKRQAMLEDASDTDASPKPQPMLAYYTPSSRRSPTKSDRARSPVKSQRSPSKAY